MISATIWQAVQLNMVIKWHKLDQTLNFEFLINHFRCHKIQEPLLGEFLIPNSKETIKQKGKNKGKKKEKKRSFSTCYVICAIVCWILFGISYFSHDLFSLSLSIPNFSFASLGSCYYYTMKRARELILSIKNRRGKYYFLY